MENNHMKMLEPRAVEEELIRGSDCTNKPLTKVKGALVKSRITWMRQHPSSNWRRE